MVDLGSGKISYLKKIFYLTHLTGLAAGALFPFLVYPLLGAPSLGAGFVLASLLMGFSIAAVMFLNDAPNAENPARPAAENAGASGR